MSGRRLDLLADAASRAFSFFLENLINLKSFIFGPPILRDESYYTRTSSGEENFPLRGTNPLTPERRER